MIIPEGQRPTVALAGHIVVPPLPVKAGWRDRQVLSGCECKLQHTEKVFKVTILLWSMP